MLPDLRNVLPPKVDLPRGIFAEIGATSRMLEGLKPLMDTQQFQALTAMKPFVIPDDARRACAGLSRLMAPFEVSSTMRDILGLSSAVASISSMRPAVTEFDSGIAVIASRALDSWRVYIDSFPSVSAPNDLFPIQAASRSVLGVTAATSILLGSDDVVEIAEEWELAPAEMREQMRAGLTRISPLLVTRLDGAWNAVTRRGPHSASQAAHSLVELIDWTLRLGCDATELEAWIAAQSDPSKYRHRDSPTREAKVRFLLHGRECDADFIDATVTNLVSLQNKLQGYKHKEADRDASAVARLLPTVEGILTLLVVS